MALRDSDAELAKRYKWFCSVGYREPVLNDPKVILDKATPDYVDKLIIKGMKEISIKTPDNNPPTKLVA